MIELTWIKCPTRAIMHFKEDEPRPGRLVRYQVEIEPANEASRSPSGQFIRFDHAEGCEVHGWVETTSVVIDEILEEWVEGEGWCKPEEVEVQAV